MAKTGKKKTKKQTKAELFNTPRCFVLREVKPTVKDKISRALSGNGLDRSEQGGYSEFSYVNPKEPIVIIDKETSCVNHAHQDTWTGVKTFTHYRLRKQRRP